MHKKTFTTAAVAALASITLVACGGDEDEESAGSGNLDRIRDSGTITIGTKFDQPLFGLQGPDGVPVGFDVEIGRIIADELGVEPNFVETLSANRETAINNNDVDIVIATYTINDARKQEIDFAGPYYIAGQSLMVLESNTDITGPDDLDGQRVCSVEGSTPAQNITDNYPDAELVTFGAYTDCLDPLRNGQVDAVTTDNVILAGYVDENPGEFKLVGDLFTEEPYGIGLPKDDDEFRDFINDTLEAAYEDGRWEEAWNSTAGVVLELPEPPAVDRY